MTVFLAHSPCLYYIYFILFFAFSDYNNGKRNVTIFRLLGTEDSNHMCLQGSVT